MAPPKSLRENTQSVSRYERQNVLRRIHSLGRRVNRTTEQIQGLQKHSLAVSKVATALGRELARRGAPVDVEGISRAALYHDVLRQRASFHLHPKTGRVEPSTRLGTAERTSQDYLEHRHLKLVVGLMNRQARKHVAAGRLNEAEKLQRAAKILAKERWIMLLDKDFRDHLSLNDLVVLLGDALVEGNNFVPIDQRFESLAKRMGAYSADEIGDYRVSFDILKHLAEERLHQQWGVDVNAVVRRLQAAKEKGVASKT